MSKVAKDIKNYYAILGIEMNASLEEIKTAFKKKALKYHPDKNPKFADDERLKKLWLDISDAYATLIDESKRRIYNSTLQTSNTSFSDYINSKFSKKNNHGTNNISIEELSSTDDEFSIEEPFSTQSSNQSESTSPQTIDTPSKIAQESAPEIKAAKNEINEIYERFKAQQAAEAQRKAQSPQSPNSPLMQKLHTAQSNTALNSPDNTPDELTIQMRKTAKRQQSLHEEFANFQNEINSNSPMSSPFQSPNKQNNSDEVPMGLKQSITDELQGFLEFLKQNNEPYVDIKRLIVLQYSVSCIFTKSGIQNAFKNYLDNYRNNTRIIEGNPWIRTLIIREVLAPNETPFWKDISSLARQNAKDSPMKSQAETISSPNMKH